MRYKIYFLDTQKIFLAIPLFIVFLSNIFITQIKGFAFIGEIAVIAGFSTLGAIFIGHRADIEILSNDASDALDNLINGLKGIFFLSVAMLPFLLAAYYFYLDLKHVCIALLCSALALNDLLSSFFLRKEKLYTYLILRSFPSIILAAIVLFLESPTLSWVLSYFASLFILLVISFVQLGSDIARLKFILDDVISNLLSKILPTITALICATGTVFWLVIITHKAGSEAAGIWSNVYRIFSLPLVFLIAVYLPFVLLKMGELKTPLEKIYQIHKFSILFFALSLFILITASQWGPIIFSILTGANESISISLLLAMIMFAVLKNFIGYHQSTFQVLKIDHFLLAILIMEIVFATILFLGTDIIGLETISKYVFLSLGVCALTLGIFLTYLTSKYYFDSSNKI